MYSDVDQRSVGYIFVFVFYISAQRERVVFVNVCFS